VLVGLGLSRAVGQPVPDLSRFDFATRHSMELACIMAQSQGPAAYGHCLRQQISSLENSPGVPDLSRFDATTRESLELACLRDKSQGPAAYGACLRDQIDKFQSSPGMPDLSRLDYRTRQSIELACTRTKHQGPARYGRCLNEHVVALRTSPGVPDISGLDYPTRRSVELGCVMIQSQGPVAYGNCVRAQLQSIGIQSAETPHEVPPATPPLATPRSVPPPATPLAWTGVEKPEMPAKLRTGSASPDAVFGSVEKSVYVLLSGPSEDSFRIRRDIRQGSAVAVTSHVALTNCHVLRGNNLHFLVKGKAVLRAAIAYGHEDSDRCALRVLSGLLVPVAGVRPYSALAIGERVYTVGSPSGLENTLGEGIVSGLRKRRDVDLVQTTAPISPGSSGGGLFDASGNLIGITTFLLRDGQNLNFAIAADTFWK